MHHGGRCHLGRRGAGGRLRLGRIGGLNLRLRLSLGSASPNVGRTLHNHRLLSAATGAGSRSATGAGAVGCAVGRVVDCTVAAVVGGIGGWRLRGRYRHARAHLRLRLLRCLSLLCLLRGRGG